MSEDMKQGELGFKEEFRTQVEVLEYLQNTGWDIKKSALSNHIRADKKLIKKDGVYLRADVDKYAAKHLKETATGQKKADRAARVQAELADIQLSREKKRDRREEIELGKLEGKYIEAEPEEIKDAGKLLVLSRSLFHEARRQAGKGIEIVGGDHSKEAEFIHWLKNDVIINALDKVAADTEYELDIKRRQK